MKPLSGMKIAVAGAGVFGLSIACLCARRGAAVSIYEPAARGDNASGVAAGMLAPGLETLLDHGSAESYSLLLQGYEAWPAFAEETIGGPFGEIASGALYVGSAAEVTSLAERSARSGVAASMLSGEAARRLQPALRMDVEAALHLPSEGRLDPVAVLQALEAGLRKAGGVLRPDAMTPEQAAVFDAVVLATGFQTHAWASEVHELAWLQPIKGHVLHFRGGPTGGPVVRSARGYAAPQRGGMIFGATMESGRCDLALDPRIVQGLYADASALLPGLVDTPFLARTGIRAATPDGRPMVGRTASGLYVAAGARRNGWLLAPLVAEAMVEALQGGAPRSAFDPGRFGVSAA